MAAPDATLQSRTILCGGGHRYHAEGTMPLGVRTFFGGTARYRTGRGSFAVDEGTWFVVNNQQPYSISFESPTMIRSFVVFFPEGWAEDVARSLAAQPDAMLDDPDARSEPQHFFETVTAGDEVVLPRMRALNAACRGRKVDDFWLEERLRDLLEGLLLSQREHLRAAAALPVARATTRRELYRRLCRGRDYLRATADHAPSLLEAAGAAALSPYHFQRSFRAVFGESPHAFVTRCRLDRARGLIERTQLPVNEVALAIGYESAGAFHRAFKARFGTSPAQFRKI